MSVSSLHVPLSGDPELLERQGFTADLSELHDLFLFLLGEG